MNTVIATNLREAKATLEQVASLETQIVGAAGVISDALLSGNKLMACGNGGSAADASHLTTEFVCRFNKDRRPYPAISLAAQGGDLTAIGNDYEFNEIFSRQVEAFGKPGDILIAFTTSGRSANVHRALVVARDLKVKTIAFLGKDGGTCAGLADIELLVTGDVTARIQEGHQFLFHTICEMVEEQLQSRG
ncbi:MAG: D-sedoheptulose-7-phosphate isomerase [Acidobacteriaceae bacterium]